MPHTKTTLFQRARAHAQTGQFAEMLVLCQQIVDTQDNDVDALLDVGALLSNFGYLTRARECYARVCDLASNDLRPRLSLANLAHNAANHAESRRLYSALQIALPNHPVIRRNALLSQEYDPDVPDAERFEQARKWSALNNAQHHVYKYKLSIYCRLDLPEMR